MKRNNPADKLAKKKQIWLERTAQILAMNQDEARELLATTRRQSVRLNPLAREAGFARPNTLGTLPEWIGPQYAWMREGYELVGDIKIVRDSEWIQSGVAFIQNAASWLPVVALEPQEGEVILDVCAAPGGKTSHIAAITQNKAAIVANDNSRARLAKLRANLERLGAEAQCTLFDATQLARKLPDKQFDKILLDAPCSGEGLMHIDHDKDFASWSVAHIKRLQQLQKRLLTQSWELLQPGGTLVYSTCTMAPEENEAVIDYLLRSREDAQVMVFDLQLPNRVPAITTWNGKAYHPDIQRCMRLKPSEQIEAFFVCKLQKTSQTT